MILHVLPLDLPRGAQRYAKAMRDALDNGRVRHRTLALFDSPFRALDADIKLAVKRSPASRLGFEPGALSALRKALARERPNVVVAHGSEPLKYLWPLVARGTPVVYYKIGVASAKVQAGLRRRLHAALLRRPDRVAGVSQECLDEAHALFGVPVAKLVLIPNGRDPQRFRPLEQGHSDQLPQLTFIGHFAESKRPEWFIAAVQRLRQSGAHFTASMIGDGPLLASLENLARAADIALLGHRDDVPALLQQSSIVAFTSLPSGEGMPGVFIEAGLCGVPVVSTEVAGARTVVADGETGYVVPHTDLDAFVGRIQSLLDDPARRAAMGSAARERCLARFTLERSTDLWRSLIEELEPAARSDEGRP
jgi:glycosyltransferase involved in cell wall biosynthesis